MIEQVVICDRCKKVGEFVEYSHQYPEQAELPERWMFILIKIKQKLERDPNDRIRGHTLAYGQHYYHKSLCPECSKEYEKKFKEFELFKEVNIVKCKKNNR